MPIGRQVVRRSCTGGRGSGHSGVHPTRWVGASRMLASFPAVQVQCTCRLRRGLEDGDLPIRVDPDFVSPRSDEDATWRHAIAGRLLTFDGAARSVPMTSPPGSFPPRWAHPPKKRGNRRER